jgi:hypothetical protein
MITNGGKLMVWKEVAMPCFNYHLLQKDSVSYNVKITKPKFYLPFLAEGGSVKESMRPRGSLARSDFSDCGLKK